jgi:glutamate 5-kinase
MTRALLQKIKTLVVKVGSNLLANTEGGLNTRFIYLLVGQLAELHARGMRVVLVSSGAVAAGTVEMKLPARPTALAEIQAAAAVGQCALMQLYREAFVFHDITVGQILLTRDGLHDRKRFLHARNTMLTLLDHDVLPVVNENDTIAVEELKLKLGDNDALAVSVAQLVDADGLVILTDVPGLYDRNPEEEDAELISHVSEFTPELFDGASGSVSGVGSGGMTTKLNAARAAHLAGIPLVVADGHQPGVLTDITAGKEIGTFFSPSKNPANARLQWIAFGRAASGSLVVDEGAAKALVEKKKSLLPVGVREVRGVFSVGDTVGIMSSGGKEIARAMINFSSDELKQIAGRHGEECELILGCNCPATVAHRDNMIIL